ncbi:MAG: hypothetical protein HY429_04265 [Candidatus Levybacteria bacterium]|nr:hypothetical protein [Candidatus Levybacteria bacterium]
MVPLHVHHKYLETFLTFYFEYTPRINAYKKKEERAKNHLFSLNKEKMAHRR